MTRILGKLLLTVGLLVIAVFGFGANASGDANGAPWIMKVSHYCFRGCHYSVTYYSNGDESRQTHSCGVSC